MRPLPIRLRLFLWYFALFATASSVLSLASWWMLQSSVKAAEYHELQERAEDVQSLLTHEAPYETIDGLRQKLADIYSLKDDASGCRFSIRMAIGSTDPSEWSRKIRPCPNPPNCLQRVYCLTFIKAPVLCRLWDIPSMQADEATPCKRASL